MTESQELMQVPPEMLSDLVEKLGSLVYGKTIERDGVTVIPVAKVRYGFGAGMGREGTNGSGGGGGGGGGGARVTPVGYIEVTSSGSRFAQFRDPGSTAVLAAVSGLSIWMVLRGLRALRR